MCTRLVSLRFATRPAAQRRLPPAGLPVCHLCVAIVSSKLRALRLRRAGNRRRDSGGRNLIGEIAFARADLHVWQSRNIHSNLAVLLRLAFGIEMRPAP